MSTIKKIKYKDGEPCKEHKGCQHHHRHPCEGCGRVGARGVVLFDAFNNKLKHKQ